ncbi:MAG: hypothetical protein ABTQ31_12725 [Rhizobiaceae bacterium]
MTCSDHVLGLAPDEPINYGETIVRMLRYRNPDGTVMDLSSATFAVMDPHSPSKSLISLS